MILSRQAAARGGSRFGELLTRSLQKLVTFSMRSFTWIQSLASWKFSIPGPHTWLETLSYFQAKLDV